MGSGRSRTSPGSGLTRLANSWGKIFTGNGTVDEFVTTIGLLIIRVVLQHFIQDYSLSKIHGRTQGGRGGMYELP